MPQLKRSLIIVMGVSGCGKSTIGAAIANALNFDFIDGDDLHPPANVKKMSEGYPLTDQDRVPWLQKIRDTAVAKTNPQDAAHDHIVIACSALKKTYRDVLRGQTEDNHNDTDPFLETIFVYLYGDKAVLYDRMSHRMAHFMKASMLESQLTDLEDPDPAHEANVIVVNINQSKDQVADQAIKKVKTLLA